MCRNVFISLIILFTSFVSSYGAQKNSTQEKDVLIVFTYSATNTAYKLIQSGIVERLDEEFGQNYNLHLEYLETDRFPEDESIKQHVDLLNEKYPSIKLNLLICVGVDGIRLLKTYCDSFLLKLPCINFDFDLKRFGIQMETHLNDKTTYLGLDLDIPLTIAKSIEIFPKTDTVYFINGSANNDVAYRKITESILQREFPDLYFVPLYDYSMEGLLIRVNQISENSLILFASYNSDGKGTPFYNNDAIRLIRLACKAPIIGYTNLGMGNGILGGNVLSFNKAGTFTGKAAIKILHGADPNSIQLKKEDYYSYQFDWRELQRLNISEEQLSPEGYELLYKEQSFIEEHKWVIIGLFAFLILQTLLIINLVASFRRQKNMIRQIRETEIKLREFSNEDRILRIGQLSASLSHELIQPLTAILSTAQAGIRFINSEDCSPQFLKELFENIIEDEKRTTSILRSIMGMMKLEDREKEKTDLNALINEVVAIYQSEAINHNVKIIVNLSDKPIFVLADKVQIQQVILNLLLNATQAMETTMDYKKNISLSISTESEQVKLTVCDNGVGFDPCIMENLFKPFLSTKEKGLGIGLSICRTLIEEHGGEIWADNLPEGGAKIDIILNTYE